MIFGTYWFAVFCVLFFPGYWLLAFSRTLRQGWLLAACFVFHYHFAGPAGVLPIILLSLFTFAAALSRRQAVLVLAIVVNVAALTFYKYIHFFSLQVLGAIVPAWGVAVESHAAAWLPGAPPLAISFFIFELVHYLYDVNHGTRPMRNFADYLSFVFYFPSLVAGPIKRYENFLPELALGLGTVSRAQVMEGLLRIARGYFLKVVLADFFTGFIAFYEPQFDGLGVTLRWLVFLALGLRIWFDFSGYSDIAIGLALMMGIRLPENFNWPYAALSIRDFWHRWHISLSSWIRDYVYIPLGGNRAGYVRKILNGIVAFALCGLWHGAAWHFIFWGLYHGLGLALSSNYRAIGGRAGEALHAFLEANGWLSWLMTFAFVAVGWVFFFYPVHVALHLLYLLTFKQPLRFLAPLAIALLVPFVIGKLPWLWNWIGRPGAPRLASLQPSFVFIGAVAGFALCCVAGKYPQTYPIYKDFSRFHLGINPESAYYPTASQVKVLAEATLPRDKIAVILGGDSVFLGLRQNTSEVWTLELQKLLGDRFVVLNLGMPNGTSSGTAAVAFEMLAPTHPRVIYAFSQIPMEVVPVDGGDTYRYFFWDAYYKGLLAPSPERQKRIDACRRAEWRTTDGQELHVGTWVDSYVNANDLWTWFGYKALWTVWSDKIEGNPIRAREYYPDEHGEAEFPALNPYAVPGVARPFNYKFKNMVVFQGNVPTGDPAIWKPILDSQDETIPPGLHPQSIACLHWLCPWTFAVLTKDELVAQDYCYDSAAQSYLADGYRAMQYGKDYPGQDFADGSHLDPEGGRRLARQLAPIILETAQALHY